MCVYLCVLVYCLCKVTGKYNTIFTYISSSTACFLTCTLIARILGRSGDYVCTQRLI